MERARYEELVLANQFREHILPIFDSLERYIDSVSNMRECNINLLNEIHTIVNSPQLRNHISEISKKANAQSLKMLKTYTLSFQSNVNGFIKLNNQDLPVRKKKLAKLLVSYINITRYVINYDEIERIIQRGPQNGEKIVLALGLVKIDEDDIKVNEEIDCIFELSRQTNAYCVIPIYGCTTDIFASINQKIHADILHLAGHGTIHSNGKPVVCFVDANMTFPTLCKKITSETNKELIFINCCNSYEFVEGNPINISTHSIVHDGEVFSRVAYDFCNRFYTTLWQSTNLEIAWNDAIVVEEPLNYYLL